MISEEADKEEKKSLNFIEAKIEEDLKVKIQQKKKKIKSYLEDNEL